MHAYRSYMSCGVYELCDVGYEPTITNFKIAVGNVRCAIMVASLTTNQKVAAKFLKKIGFKKVGRAIRNPNSDNDIILFRKHITADDRKRYGINSI